MFSNQNLCKYIYATTPLPLSEPDILDTERTLLFKNVFPYPIVPNVTDSAKTLVTVVLDDFKLDKSFKSSKIYFNVFCHIDLWKISNKKLRPYGILQELDSLFNNQRIIGIGKLSFDKCRWITVNEKFQGYHLSYEVYEFN